MSVESTSPIQGLPQIDPVIAQQKLLAMSESLETMAYDLAGHLESLTIARLILMSHEVAQIAGQVGRPN